MHQSRSVERRAIGNRPYISNLGIGLSAAIGNRPYISNLGISLSAAIGNRPGISNLYIGLSTAIAHRPDTSNLPAAKMVAHSSAFGKPRPGLTRFPICPTVEASRASKGGSHGTWTR